MIDVIHTKQGKSFKGLVDYLILGSKGDENPERVAWTETRNLAVQKPQLAAKVMAATALDQARLKQNAGIPNTGRKSSNHVLHYTLSWQEGQSPTREEMMAAVDGSLAALGEAAGKKGGKNGKKGRQALRDQFASEHQVLAVAHQDTTIAHVHVVVNRVHPEHGVMLPSSNDFLKLSRWAERHEREHGGLVVDQRAINNAARSKGKKVYAAKRPSRDVYELEAAANDNLPSTQQLKKEQRSKDAALARKSAETRRRAKAEWSALEESHRQQKREHQAELSKALNVARRAVQEAFAERWKELHHRQKAAVQGFENAETNLVGKAKNALASLLSLKGPVNVLWSQGARVEAFKKDQAAERWRLEQEEGRARKDAERRVRADAQAKLADLGVRFQIERQEAILRHQMDKAALRAAWRQRETDRAEAWKAHQEKVAEREAGVASARALEIREGFRQLQEQRDRDADRGHDQDRGR